MKFLRLHISDSILELWAAVILKPEHVETCSKRSLKAYLTRNHKNKSNLIEKIFAAIFYSTEVWNLVLFLLHLIFVGLYYEYFSSFFKLFWFFLIVDTLNNIHSAFFGLSHIFIVVQFCDELQIEVVHFEALVRPNETL